VLACDPSGSVPAPPTSSAPARSSWRGVLGERRAGGQAPIDLGAAAFRSITEIRAAADELGLPWWTVTPFESPGAAGGDAAGLAEPGGAEEDQAGRPAFSMGASPAEAYRGDTTRALADVRRWLATSGGWCSSPGTRPAQRLAELLRADGLGARLGDLDGPPEPGVPCVTTGLIDQGFTWEAARLAVICEADLAGQRTGSRDTRRMPKPAARGDRPAPAQSRRLRRP